jgi:thiol:disulfide interchange protein DsbC
MQSISKALCAVLAALSLVAIPAHAQEAAIRKNLAERLSRLGTVDEVTKTPMAGLYEVRVGDDLYYTDAEANFLLQGPLVDTKSMRNLTEERLNKLNAIDFAQLPLKDAFTIVRGDGKRKIAVFEDPNCPYCKRFERDLQKVDNVTVYMFLYPILGPDSTEKSRHLWCAKDKGRAWQDWMVRDVPVPQATCDTAALTRNLEFGKKHHVSGTPTLLFADGTRVGGALPAAQVEKQLANVKP